MFKKGIFTVMQKEIVNMLGQTKKQTWVVNQITGAKMLFESIKAAETALKRHGFKCV
jgi:L-lysine 2,3-aminomutase